MERLNKFLAHAGVGSRRHCDDLIVDGRVTVNGDVVREMGMRVSDADEVHVDGKPLHQERLVYWLLHKPPGYLCTNHDPAGRPRAVDLLPHVMQRVYTVGRLDEESEGLLLMTNDGELAHRLMHPRFGIRKTYLVQVAGYPSDEQLEQLLKGIWLSDGHVRARRVKRLKSQGESTWLEIVLSEGKNREIRRMLARLGHKVLRLRRVTIGPLRLDRLPAGKSRRVKPEELARLREMIDRPQGADPSAGSEEDQPDRKVRRSRRSQRAGSRASNGGTIHSRGPATAPKDSRCARPALIKPGQLDERRRAPGALDGRRSLTPSSPPSVPLPPKKSQGERAEGARKRGEEPQQSGPARSPSARSNRDRHLEGKGSHGRAATTRGSRTGTAESKKDRKRSLAPEEARTRSPRKRGRETSGSSLPANAGRRGAQQGQGPRHTEKKALPSSKRRSGKPPPKPR